jgi:hypothetical protein
MMAGDHWSMVLTMIIIIIIAFNKLYYSIAYGDASLMRVLCTIQKSLMCAINCAVCRPDLM